MPDTKKMPADGGGIHKGEPDGVSGMPEAGEEGQVNGRVGGGESAGGAYPNPHSGKPPQGAGLLGIGGQSDKAYYGGENPNATAGGETLPEGRDGEQSKIVPARKAHRVQTRQQGIDVIEDDGVAAAEATGKVGTDAPYEREQETPGGG